LQEVDFRGAINIEYAFVDQTQRAILGLTDDTVTQLQQQITQAEQEINLLQIRLVQICPSQIYPSQIRPSQIYPSQIRPSQICPSQIRPSQICPSQIHP
jgi:hypothetical protein